MEAGVWALEKVTVERVLKSLLVDLSTSTLRTHRSYLNRLSTRNVPRRLQRRTLQYQLSWGAGLLLARSLADPTAFDEAELEQLLATLKQHADDASLADKASQTLALARRLRDAAAAGPSVAAAAAASDAPASAEDAAQEGTAAQFSRMMLAHAAKGATKLVDKARTDGVLVWNREKFLCSRSFVWSLHAHGIDT